MSENEISGESTAFTPYQDGTKLIQLSIDCNILRGDEEQFSDLRRVVIISRHRQSCHSRCVRWHQKFLQ